MIDRTYVSTIQEPNKQFPGLCPIKIIRTKITSNPKDRLELRGVLYPFRYERAYDLYQEQSNQLQDSIKAIIQLIKDFDDSDIFDFEFNESGDFKIAFNYTHQNEEYIYEYSVTNEGDIESCIVYEKDVLNNKRGEEDCKITFTPNDSDTIPLTDALDAIISTYFDADPNYFDNDRDLFGYHTESN